MLASRCHLWIGIGGFRTRRCLRRPKRHRTNPRRGKLVQRVSASARCNWCCLGRHHDTGIGLMLHAGLRASEVVGLELDDVTIGLRSGHVVCRHGKGNKQRIVPLSVEARRVVQAYLETRPPVQCQAVFIGEREALTYSGLRAVCSKYAAITGVTFTAHKLRHTFAHRYLQHSNNDIVGLAQVLGHESLNTTSIYSRRGQDELQASIDGLRYE